MCSYKNNMLQLAFGVVLCLSQGLSHASGYVDVLDLPAKVSPLAVTSPLSGMARAGDRLVAVGQRGQPGEPARVLARHACIPMTSANTGNRPRCRSVPTLRR